MKCINCNTVTSTRFSVCDKPQCRHIYYNSTCDNIITNMKSKITAKFLLRVNHAAINNDRRAPHLFDKPPVSMKELKENINVIKETNIYLDKYDSEDDAFVKLGKLFSTLKYIFKCEYDIAPITCGYAGGTIIRYDINYDQSRERKFDGPGDYVFHGSSIENWCSILRNGLIPTNKDLKVNGSAYGDGIYTAKSLNTAIGYATKSTIVAICQTNVNIKEYEKGKGFCHVIPKSSMLCIRSLIEIKKDSQMSIHYDKLQILLVKAFQIKLENRNLQKSMLKARIGKRIDKELSRLNYKYICESNCVHDLTIISHRCDSDGHRIHVIYGTFPVKPPIIYVSGPVVDSPRINKFGVYLYPELNDWIASMHIADLVDNLSAILITAKLMPTQYINDIECIYDSIQIL